MRSGRRRARELGSRSIAWGGWEGGAGVGDKGEQRRIAEGGARAGEKAAAVLAWGGG